MKCFLALVHSDSFISTAVSSLFKYSKKKKKNKTRRQTMRNPYGFNQKDFSRLASGQQAFRLYT